MFAWEAPAPVRSVALAGGDSSFPGWCGVHTEEGAIEEKSLSPVRQMCTNAVSHSWYEIAKHKKHKTISAIGRR